MTADLAESSAWMLRAYAVGGNGKCGEVSDIISDR